GRTGWRLKRTSPTGAPSGGARSPAPGRATPISPAASSTTVRTPATSWSGRARGRRWRGSPAAPSASCCWSSSGSKSGATSPNWEGAPQGLGGARRDSSRAGARHQPGGGYGGRHDDRRAAGAARGHEADLDADVAAQDGGSEDRGAGPGAVRALGCHRGAGDGGHRRGDGRARARAGGDRAGRRLGGAAGRDRNRTAARPRRVPARAPRDGGATRRIRGGNPPVVNRRGSRGADAADAQGPRAVLSQGAHAARHRAQDGG